MLGVINSHRSIPSFFATRLFRGASVIRLFSFPGRSESIAQFITAPFHAGPFFKAMRQNIECVSLNSGQQARRQVLDLSTGSRRHPLHRAHIAT
jgi:hypothetical protein